MNNFWTLLRNRRPKTWEQVISSLKQEWTGDRLYQTRQEAIADVREYLVVHYNSTHRHSTIGYTTPMNYETDLNKGSGTLDHYKIRKIGVTRILHFHPYFIFLPTFPKPLDNTTQDRESLAIVLLFYCIALPSLQAAYGTESKNS